MHSDLDSLKKQWRSLDSMRLPDDISSSHPAVPRLRKAAYVYVCLVGGLAPAGGILLALLSPLYTPMIKVLITAYFALIALVSIGIFLKSRKIDLGALSVTEAIDVTTRIRNMLSAIAALSLALLIIADAFGRDYFNGAFMSGLITGLIPALIIIVMFAIYTRKKSGKTELTIIIRSCFSL